MLPWTMLQGMACRRRLLLNHCPRRSDMIVLAGAERGWCYPHSFVNISFQLSAVAGGSGCVLRLAVPGHAMEQCMVVPTWVLECPPMSALKRMETPLQFTQIWKGSKFQEWQAWNDLVTLKVFWLQLLAPKRCPMVMLSNEVFVTCGNPNMKGEGLLFDKAWLDQDKEKTTRKIWWRRLLILLCFPAFSTQILSSNRMTYLSSWGLPVKGVMASARGPIPWSRGRCWGTKHLASARGKFKELDGTWRCWRCWRCFTSKVHVEQSSRQFSLNWK